MPEVGSASLAIIPSFDGFQAKLEGGSAKALTAAGASGGAKFGDAAGKSAAGKFKTRMRSAAKVAAVGFAAAGAVAFKFAGDSVAEAREAQKVGALTASTIKATGKAAKVTAKHVGDLAGKISAKTGIDGEAIQAGQNMLLTFKNIRNEAGAGNKIFDQTSRTLVDLSSAMGTDAKSSAIQLGKALNDPLKGISALSRVGVTFDEQQKKQIAGFVKAGETMKAQKVILRELKGEFGGAAKAQATEADKLSVAWGNFKEEIGTQLLPVMDDLAVFLRKEGIPALEDAGKWVNKTGIPAMRDFADEIRPVVGHAKDLGKFLGDLPNPAKLAGLTALFGGVAATKLRGGKSGPLGAVGSALGIAKPVPVFVTNPGFGPGGGKAGKASKSKIPMTPIPLTATPYLAPLLTSGDRGPHKYDRDAQGAVKFLGDKLGLGRSGTGLDGALSNLVKDDPGKAFRIISKAAKLAGEDVNKYLNTDALPKTVSAVGLAERKYGSFENAGAKVEQGARRLARELFGDVVQFDKAGNAAKRYGSVLDGLDGRTVTTILETRYVKNDTGAGGGPNPQPPGRSGGHTFIHNGNVVAPSPRDYVEFNRRRARNANGGGVNW